MSANACHDCAAEVGTPHEDGCDVARCLWTGMQRLQCVGGLAAECCKVLREAKRYDLAEELAHYLDLDGPEHDCGRDVWTGVWPGDLDAIALGLFCYWGPPWIECGPDHPEARPDLNRLATVGRWDRESMSWVARQVEA